MNVITNTDEEISEELEDLKAVAARENEETYPFEKLVAEFRAKHLI